MKEALPDLSPYIFSDPNNFLRDSVKQAEPVCKSIQTVESLLKNHNGEDKENLYHLLSYLGNMNRIIKKYEKGMEYLQSALQLAKEIEDRKKEVVSYIRLGELFKYVGNHQQALFCFDQAEQLCQGTDCGEYQDFVLQHRGKCLLELGHNEEALFCLKCALELRQKKEKPDLIQSTETAIDFVERLL